MTYSINLHPATADIATGRIQHSTTERSTTEHSTTESGGVYDFTREPALVLDADGGYEPSEPDAYARRLAEEAEAWLALARTRARMREETVVGKALQSLAFSMRHRARSFAVPSKLAGTSKHQAALWALVRSQAEGRASFGTPLDVGEVPKDTRPRLVVSHEGEALGAIQSKHVPWLRPLVPFGARAFLTRVTGEERGYTLGCNVVFGHIGSAVAALGHALGTDTGATTGAAVLGGHVGGGGYSGGGYSGDGYSGDGALRPTGRPSLALSVAKPQVDTPPGDVVLYREIDGTARATIEHVYRHSPTGIEWGYAGSGPADLAWSVLLAFTDDAVAERLYARYLDEVVARLPRSGGVIRAADVRAWLAAQTDEGHTG